MTEHNTYSLIREDRDRLNHVRSIVRETARPISNDRNMARRIIQHLRSTA